MNFYNTSINSLNHKRTKKRSILQNYETYVNNVETQLNQSQPGAVRRVHTAKLANVPEKKNQKSITKLELVKKPSVKMNQAHYLSFQNKNRNFYSDKKAKKMETMSMIYSHCELEVKISNKNSYEHPQSRMAHENRVKSNAASNNTIEHEPETQSLNEGRSFIENCKILNFVELSSAKK